MCAFKASFALIIECTCLFECMSSSVGDIGKNLMRRAPSGEECTTTTPGGWYGAPTGDSCTTPIRLAAFWLKTGGRLVRDRHSGGGGGRGRGGAGGGGGGSFPIVLLGLSCPQSMVTLIENSRFLVDFALFGSLAVAAARLRVMKSCDGRQTWALETLTGLLLSNCLWRASTRTA